jgi:hypothetical protein
MKEKNLQTVILILNPKERRRRINKGKLLLKPPQLTLGMFIFKITTIICNNR